MDTGSPTSRDLQRFINTGALIGDFAGFHIDPRELSDLVEQHGIGCELRRAVRCPCVRIETGGPRSGCPHCNGLRFVYPEKLREPAVALVLNRDPRRTYKAAGEIVTGIVHVTYPIGIIPAQGDILLPAGEVHLVHETIFHAQLEVDLRSEYMQSDTPDEKAPLIEPRRDSLLYEEVEVEWVHWIRSEDDKLINARQGADFKIVRSEVVWKEGRGPGGGEPFTIRYRAPAAYISAGAEPVFRSESENYPYRTQMARLDKWQSDGKDLRE